MSSLKLSLSLPLVLVVVVELRRTVVGLAVVLVLVLGLGYVEDLAREAGPKLSHSSISESSEHSDRVSSKASEGGFLMV